MMNRKSVRQFGFTFIEVVSVMVASSTLALMGMPMLTDYNAQVAANGTQELFAEALTKGRHHAVTTGATVKVCGSNDGKTCNDASWSGGWLVYTVPSSDKTSSGIQTEDQIVTAYQFEQTDLILEVLDENSQAVSEIRFDPQGFNKSQQRLEAFICAHNHKSLGDKVVVERNGRVRLSSNPNTADVSGAGKNSHASQCKQA
jgi:Tfp pilus assembly protein FimT